MGCQTLRPRVGRRIRTSTRQALGVGRAEKDVPDEPQTIGSPAKSVLNVARNLLVASSNLNVSTDPIDATLCITFNFSVNPDRTQRSSWFAKGLSVPDMLHGCFFAVVEASRELFERAVVECAHGQEGDVHWTQFDDARAKVE